MEHIRKLAWISIARGCSFGGLAILTLMIGFSATPGRALDFGGLGFLLMAVVLMIKAARADRMPHKRTEIWLMLDRQDRPPPEVAPGIISRTRHDVILRFAYMSAVTGAWCFALAAVLQFSGLD